MRRTKLLKPFVMLLMLTMAMLVPQTAWAEDVVQVASGEDLIAAIVDNNATNVPVTIQFTQDIEVSSDIEINGMQNITFDLNGHKFVIPAFDAYGKAVLKNGIVYSAYRGFSLSNGEIDLLNIDIFAMNNFYLSGNSKLNIHNNVNITCPEGVVYVAAGSLNIDGICSFITTGTTNTIYNDQGSVNVGFNYRLTAVDGEEIVQNQSWGKSLLCVYNGTCTTAASHNAVHHAAVTSATCLEAVHAEYYSCSKCGRFFSDATCTETVSELTFSQGSHSYGELIEATEATCTSSGTIAHYECATCHNLFDADKNRVYGIKSADPLGHDFDADGICQRCGAEMLKATTLHIGNNNVNIQTPTDHSTWDSDRNDSANYTMFKYTVKADGDVTIKGVGDLDTYGVLYDAGMKYIKYSDDDNGRNFMFSIQDAKAGDVYYIGARGWGGNVIGDYIICVEANVPECAPGEHELTLHEGVAATCTTAGKKAYYECSKCEKSFADAAGTEEITDLTIPALGHDLDADSKCQHDGCDYAISPLVAGDNNVVIGNPTTGEEWEDDQENPEHYTMFKYTVKADGDITFRSVGGDDTYCVLYDSSMEYLDCSDGNEENGYMDFVLVRNNVKAGEVYYLGVRGYGDDVIGDYIIRVEITLPECAPGEHELTLHEGVAATCTTAGNKDYYECGKCEHRYVDAEGTEEITDVIIPALGHDLDADGKCQREGCDYLNLLVAGDNNVVIGNPTLSDGDWWDAEDDLTPRHYTLFKLVVAEDNDITIKGVGDEDTYGVLYDAGMNYIADSDDDEDSNFKLSILDAKAGEVYYVGARWYNDHAPAEYVINVIYGPVEDDGPDGPDGPDDPDGPDGPVDITGTITVGDTSVDITDGDEVSNFNSENEGKMSMEIAVVEDQPHFVLKLNNAEITAGAIDDGGAVGIDYFGSVPLIINLTGKNSIKFSDVTGAAMGVYTESELMFTGTGSLDINCADGTAPIFVGIAADNLITYSQEIADDISSSPMDLSFKGSININGKTQMVAFGLVADDDLILTSGEFNINTESAQPMMTAGMMVKDGNVALMDTKVKINSNLAGIAFAAPEDEEPDGEPAALVAKKLMPKKSSRKAKAGKKKINIMGPPPFDLFVSGADVEIDAAFAAIVNARQNPSCEIVPASTPGGVAHIAAGTSKETAEDQVIDGEIDIFAEAAGKNYLHIYETGEAIRNVHLYDTEAARDQYFETEGLDGCPSYYALFATNTPYLNVTLHRTFQDDGWYTLCLPFDLEVAGSPFSKAARFAGIERIISDDDLGSHVSLGFNTVDKMIAGIPYLVKVDHTVENPEFKNIKFNYVKPGYEAYTDDYMVTYAFNGSFDPVETFNHHFAGIGSGNMVNAINNGTKIRGFRGFFTAPEPYVKLVNGGIPGAGDPKAKAMTFTVDGANEGAATDIDPDVIVNRNAGDGKTYNVMGQRVNKNAKGLIIRNGKTIFKK